MHDEGMRYLRIVNQQLSGPLRALVTDKRSGYLMHVTHGVLVRTIAEMELAVPHQQKLPVAGKRWCAELRKLLTTNDPGLRSVAELEASCNGDTPEATKNIETALITLIDVLSGRKDAASQMLLAEIVGNDHQHWQQIEQRCTELLAEPAANTASAPGGLTDAQRQQLLIQLRQQCGESDALVITEVTPLSGGYSKQTILVELKNATSLPEQIVLRHDRPESPVGTSVSVEFPLLKVLHAAGVKVPRPWMVDKGETVGAPLMVVSRSEGRVVADGHHFREATAGLSSCAIALAQELAKLHRVPLADVPASVPGRDISNAEMMRRELENFHQIWRDSTHTSVAVEAAFAWLLGHLDCVGDEKTLVHGDIRFHNMLCDEGGIHAILDWELSSIQNPALDLGYCYHHVRQLIDWKDFLNAYRDAGGSIPPKERLAFYILRTEVLTASLLTRIENAFLSGSNDMIDLAYAGSQLRQHCVYLLTERLQKILSGVEL